MSNSNSTISENNQIRISSVLTVTTLFQYSKVHGLNILKKENQLIVQNTPKQIYDYNDFQRWCRSLAINTSSFESQAHEAYKKCYENRTSFKVTPSGDWLDDMHKEVTLETKALEIAHAKEKITIAKKLMKISTRWAIGLTLATIATIVAFVVMNNKKTNPHSTT